MLGLTAFGFKYSPHNWLPFLMSIQYTHKGSTVLTLRNLMLNKGQNQGKSWERSSIARAMKHPIFDPFQKGEFQIPLQYNAPNKLKTFLRNYPKVKPIHCCVQVTVNNRRKIKKPTLFGHNNQQRNINIWDRLLNCSTEF